MSFTRTGPVAALVASGLLFGSTVPLTKAVVDGVGPAWLSFVRFAAAGLVLAVFARRSLRAAATAPVLVWGAVGYGAMALLQNDGIARTSVTHAALLIGATPVLIALLASRSRRSTVPPLAWAGFVLALAGAGLVAAGSGGASSARGDGLVMLSVLCMAAFAVAQPGLLSGRDPVAVTAAQFAAAAVLCLPAAGALEGAPPTGLGASTLVTVLALVVAGTLVPFTLFAYAQARVSAPFASAFLNLEPLVGAITGVVVFSDPYGGPQLLGGTAILAGIALSTVRLLRPPTGRPDRPQPPSALPALRPPGQSASRSRAAARTSSTVIASRAGSGSAACGSPGPHPCHSTVCGPAGGGPHQAGGVGPNSNTEGRT